MGRSPCCSKVGLKRGPWSTSEDTLLTNFIQQHGEGQWRSLPKNAGLLRCGKSCRLRWMNYLRPGIKRGGISQDEEDLIVRMHGLLGNRWTLIAGRLPGRTDNEIKNYWNTYLIKIKKLHTAGIIHPQTRKELPKQAAKVKKASVSAATSKKNNKKQKKAENTDLCNKASSADEDDNGKSNLPKTKIYMPKPVRVSSASWRTNSVDSFLSASSSGEAGESDGCRPAAETYAPVAWPIVEMEDADFEAGDDFLGGYCVLPVPESDPSGDVITLDQVYDAYMQLL